MPPIILILATGQWNSTARQALALAALECEVHLMAAKGHPALETGAVRTRYAYNPLRPLHSVREAIHRAQPVSVIPADELAVLHLEELFASDANLRPLLLRSIGGAEVMSAARSRMELLQHAQAEGIAVPETVAISAESELDAAAKQLGLPMVMKADSTSGGRGVRIVESVSAAQATLKDLSRPPNLPEAVWRALVWKERTHFRMWAKGHRRGVTAQRFLKGRERTAMAAAHNGEVLAVVCLEVVETWALRGPSSVLRVIDDTAMERAVRGVVRRVGLSGLCGFDFMTDAEGRPLLIEMNPRPTQVAHLALGTGRDLMAAYVRGVVGIEVADRPAVTEGDLIALFPQELQRDAQSEYVRHAYHDVPWDQPAFIKRVLVPLSEVVTGDARWRG